MALLPQGQPERYDRVLNMVAAMDEAGFGSCTNHGRPYKVSRGNRKRVVASSRADPSKTASSAIAVGAVPVITVSIDPPRATLVPSATLRFSAGVTGTADGAVAWSIAEGSAGGSIDASGVYRAPERAGRYHIVATSHADATRSAAAEVKVTPGVAVTVAPASVTVLLGEQQRFVAAVSGATDVGVTWTIAEGPPGGSIDASGLYTAPSQLACITWLRRA
jgi:hypothetical protein